MMAVKEMHGGMLLRKNNDVENYHKVNEWDEKIIAIITARGGSKRIPRKNIKEFCGKPIIEYSIEAALKSNIFDEVMVSTDDSEIAQIAINAGAKVPFFRSEATSNDFSTTRDVLIEVLTEYEKGEEHLIIWYVYILQILLLRHKN